MVGICILGVLVVLWLLPKDAFQFFRSPTEVLAAPPAEDEYFQLGGLVKEGSMTPVSGVQFSFVVTDGASEVPVTYVGNDPAPDLFGEGQGTTRTPRIQIPAKASTWTRRCFFNPFMAHHL